MNNIEERRYILWLNNISGIGSAKGNMLIEMFGSAKKVYELDKSTLSAVSFLSTKVVTEIINNDLTSINTLEEQLQKHNIKYVTIVDKNYPFYLKEIKNPPLVLYYKGELLDLEKQTPIAIIGARNCTHYGKEMALKISKELGINGAIVVSGLAKGIDSFAHKGALTVGAKTIAVVASGLDICYPLENQKLCNDIINNGCVISEYPPGTKPLKQYFPQRNRIIAGISRGILVVEAKRRSGTFITINFGADEGRDIFCTPGNITSALSEGTNQLIREGAYLVTSGDEILEEYYGIDKKFKQLEKEDKSLKKLTTEEKLLYLEIKNKEGICVDELLTKDKFKSSSLTYLLMVLELKGYIQKKVGNTYYTI